MPKITELTAYTTPNVSNDVLPIVDVANDTTKKISVQNLLNPLVNQSVRTDASPTFATVKLTNLTDGYIPRHTSDSVGLENSPIYTDGTNVGIGTTAPQNKLEIVGDGIIGFSSLPSGYPLRLRTAGPTDSNWGVEQANQAGAFNGVGMRVYGGISQGFYVRDVTNNIYRFVVEGGTGNVGIGTTAPSYKLTVAGGDIYGYNNLYIAGYVGIGTTAPRASLDVVSSVVPNLRVGASASALYGAFLELDATAITSGRQYRIFSTGRSAGEGVGKLVFQDFTAGTARLVIDSSGNVGIGTTAPQQKLHIYSSTGIRLQSSGTADGGKMICFVNSDGTTKANFGRGNDSQGWTGITSHTLNCWVFQVTDDGTVLNYGGIYPGTGSAIQSLYCFYQDASGIRTNGQFYVDSNVGIGLTNPSYQLQLSQDSAAKPSTNTWTVTSDERLKKDIVEADLTRCYEIVKTIPLKYFHWRDDIFTPEQIKDRGMLGWLANDVEPVFPKAVDVIPKFAGSVDIGEETEEYEEQEYTVETVEREEKVIEIRDGKPVQVVKKVTEEIKTPVFDYIEVVDEQGNVVYNEDGTPLTHPIPRMVKKTRVKKTRVEIENCKTVNSDQIMKALYGAVQLLIQKVEQLEAQLGK